MAISRTRAGWGCSRWICASISGWSRPSSSPKTTAGLRAALPDFAAPQNPVDLTAQILTDPGMLMRVLPLLEADPGVDMLVFQVALFGAATDVARFAGDVARVAATTQVVAMTARSPTWWRSSARRACSPSTTPRSRSARWPAWRRSRAGGRAGTRDSTPPRRRRPRRRRRRRAPGPRRSSRRRLPQRVGEPAPARALRAAAGGQPARRRRPRRRRRPPRSATGGGEDLRPDLPHKSDVGGVALGLADGAAVRRRHAGVLDTVAVRAPRARLDGLLVQRQARASSSWRWA